MGGGTLIPEKRPALWDFAHLDTLRRRLIQRADRKVHSKRIVNAPDYYTSATHGDNIMTHSATKHS
ncbi:MAG: hypothetical protein ACREV1_13835, partial [Gammaproteobacteria bacterium]